MRNKIILLLFFLCAWPLYAQSSVTAKLTAQGAACGSASASSLITSVGGQVGGATITLSGTWSGTVGFYVSGDQQTTWVAAGVTPSSGGSAVTTATGNGSWQLNTAGYSAVCVLFSTYSSGTAVATIRLSSASARSNGGGGGGGGSGTVTSVTFTGDGIVDSSTPSSAVTTSGTVTASILDQAADTLFGNPTSGSTAPSFFTVAAPLGFSGGQLTCATCGSGGGGDTITSPNSTLAVGGSDTNTTLDLEGGAGEIMAGATPALTYTPTLGKSGTAGTLSLFASSGNFTTTFGSAATASNTVLFPATVPTTLHGVHCVTSSTTCTLADNGYAYNAIPNADLANSAITIAGTSVSLGGSTSSLPSPGAIGGSTPATITGTTITANTSLTVNGGTAQTGTQGSDTKLLTAGTISGTSAALCTDANGGATTSSCPSGGGPGTGTQNEISYWSGSSALGSVSTTTTPNGVPQTIVQIPSGGALTTPAAVLPGVVTRAVTGATSTDTIASTDCNPGRVSYSGSVAVAVTLPTATTLAVPNCVFRIANNTSGSSTAVTVTPTTWTVRGSSSLVIAQGQIATFYVDPAGSNWEADVNDEPIVAGSNITITRGQYGPTVAASGGGSCSDALTMNNGGSGASSGSTFNCSAAVTISYNTIGASPLAGSASLTTVGTIATGTWEGTLIATGYGGTGSASPGTNAAAAWTISDATTTVGTTTINANTCSASATTVTMTGLTTSMTLAFTPTSDVSGVAGWGSTGGLTIDAWPTSNTVNYKVCNQTASNITPGGSVTFNISAR